LRRTEMTLSYHKSMVAGLEERVAEGRAELDRLRREK